jgi:hypothetical protein
VEALGLTLLLPFAMGLRAWRVDARLADVQRSAALSTLTPDDHVLLVEAAVRAVSLRCHGPGRVGGSGSCALEGAVQHSGTLLQHLRKVRWHASASHEPPHCYPGLAQRTDG